MFDRIAPRYDRLNRVLSFGSDLAWRRRAVALARLGPGERGLDVGAGTGDFGLALLRASDRSSSVIGVDISPGMLVRSTRRAAREGYAGRYRAVLGSAESLPLPDRSVDRVVAGFVIRNVGKIPRALAELRRVLRPGGRVVILDLYTPGDPRVRVLYRAYARIFPRLAGALGSDPEAYRYLPRSIEAFADPDGVADQLREAKFTRVSVERLTFGVAVIHVGEA